MLISCTSFGSFCSGFANRLGPKVSYQSHDGPRKSLLLYTTTINKNMLTSEAVEYALQQASLSIRLTLCDNNKFLDKHSRGP